MEKSFQSKILGALGILTVLVVISLGLNIYTLATKGNQNEITEESSKIEEVLDLEIFSLTDDLTTNIKSDGSVNHIVNTAISFGIDKKDKNLTSFLETIKSKEIIVRNEVLKLLREQTFKELSEETAQEQLGEEIQRRVNNLLQTEMIKEVYFSKFFVQ